MVGTGDDSIRIILRSLGNNLQQPDQPESRFIFSHSFAFISLFRRDIVYISKLNFEYNVPIYLRNIFQEIDIIIKKYNIDNFKNNNNN